MRERERGKRKRRYFFSFIVFASLCSLFFLFFFFNSLFTRASRRVARPRFFFFLPITRSSREKVSDDPLRPPCSSSMEQRRDPCRALSLFDATLSLLSHTAITGSPLPLPAYCPPPVGTFARANIAPLPLSLTLSPPSRLIRRPPLPYRFSVVWSSSERCRRSWSRPAARIGETVRATDDRSWRNSVSPRFSRGL